MKKNILMLLIAGLVLVSCDQTTKQSSDNPFFGDYNTPFNVPPFDKIKVEHYKPAFEKGIEDQNKEIQAIIDNKEAPTFENTIVEFEYSGEILNKVASVFFNYKETDATEEIDALAQEIYPMVTKHQDNIFLNPALFAKVKAVYDQKASFNLTTEQNALLDKIYKQFVRGGANLDEKGQARLREINEKLSVLELTFEANVREETNAFELVVENKDDLAGIPESVVAMAAETAKEKGMEGKWIFTLDRPSIMPFLQTCQNRELRKQIFTGYLMRANNNNAHDNKANITEQTVLRAEKAQLLGFNSYAAYALDDKMAKTPAAVDKLLMEVWTPALKVAKQEAADMQSMIKKEGGNFALEGQDWSYYAEKIRKERYDLNEDMLMPYFKLENVLQQGVFGVANKLWGITFNKVTNLPLYNPEAVTYEVKDKDGSHLAIMYFDFHPRKSKGVGAWMTEFETQHRTRDGKDVRPIISIVCNFSKPTPGKPALLNLDEVETLFHEFGHGLHGLFSQCTYRSVAGTSVPTDFVELPSQIMENWAVEPEVLRMYAHHYETGEVIPDSLINKIDESSKFNQGFVNVEYLAASFLDMAYHTRTDLAPIADVNAFEQTAMDNIGLIPQIPPRYRSTYFKHIFGGGYTAGYNSYKWAEVLDADGFEAFKEKGIFDQATAESYRKNILEKGGSDDPMKLYKAFRGHEPQTTPLLKRSGLID